MASSSAPMKPKIRRKGREAGAKGATKAKPSEDVDLEQLDNEIKDIVVRERERGPDAPPTAERPSSRLGRLVDKTKEATKEAIRPMSGLLKRPGSRSGSRDRGGRKEVAEDGSPRPDRPPSARPLKKGGLFGGGGREEEEDSPRLGASGMIELADSEPTGYGAGARFGGGGDSPVIPELEDGAVVGEGGVGVAQAPTIAINRVSEFGELDSELLKQSAFASLGDLDLSLLTKFLVPESDVRDEEGAWSWDYLYTSLCSELRQEWEDQDEEDEDAKANGQNNPAPLPTFPSPH